MVRITSVVLAVLVLAGCGVSLGVVGLSSHSGADRQLEIASPAAQPSPRR